MTLVAACDLNPERLRACGERFRVPGLYADFEAMLRTERPDVLHVVTPPRIREEPIRLAAEHGVKAVIVEKPVALTLAQARIIRGIAEQTGIKIAVMEQPGPKVLSIILFVGGLSSRLVGSERDRQVPDRGAVAEQQDQCFQNVRLATVVLPDQQVHPPQPREAKVFEPSKTLELE